MERVNILLVLCVLTVSSCLGLMCQFPHCELVKCPEVTTCNGTIKRGGGYCGCCIACFTTLEEGEPCEFKDALDQILYPPTAVCDYGLQCARNTSTCEPGFPWVG